MLSMMLSNNVWTLNSPKNYWGKKCVIWKLKGSHRLIFSLMSLNEKLLGWLFANKHPLQIFAAVVGDPSKSSETISPLLTSYYGKKKNYKTPPLP